MDFFAKNPLGPRCEGGKKILRGVAACRRARHPPQLGGAAACVAAEGRGKAAGVLIADAVRDLGHRQVALLQKPGGGVHPQPATGTPYSALKQIFSELWDR